MPPRRLPTRKPGNQSPPEFEIRSSTPKSPEHSKRLVIYNEFVEDIKDTLANLIYNPVNTPTWVTHEVSYFPPIAEQFKPCAFTRDISL